MADLSGVMSVRVVFNAGSVDQPIEWFNNHEIEGTGEALSSSEVDGICAAFVVFHRQLLLQPFRIVRVIISSYAEDGKPYNPDTLAIRLFNAQGTFFGSDGAGQALPLTNILRLQRDVDKGRPGALLLRGCLHESMIQSDPLTGAVGLTGLADLQSTVGTAFGQLQNSLANNGAAMVMAYGDGVPENVRGVQGLTVRGVGSKQLRNKVAPRYPAGLFGNIMRALDTVKDNQAALETIKDLLQTLEWLGPLLA